jgi:hypothetical protein
MQRIYNLKVTLRDTDPPIWRRVLVPGDLSFADLHRVLQIAMGWDDSQPHRFVVGKATYGSEEGDADESDATLDEVLGTRVRAFVYAYDFDDGWVLELRVERPPKDQADLAAPTCVEGDRAAPPEDCGSPWSFESMLEAIDDPEHPDREHWAEWIDTGFDPERFDVVEINERLSSITTSVWIGGVIVPAVADGDRPGSPTALAMWLDEVDGTVIGQAPTDPSEWRDAAVELLEAALEDLAAGDLRRPTRVEVSDEELAARIRPMTEAHGLRLALAALPTLEEIERTLRTEMSRLDHECGGDAECLEAEVIPDALIARFFESAARLYRSEPWSCCPRGDLFALSAPGLELPEAVIALDGDVDREFSMVLFESLEDYEAFIAANEGHDDDDAAPAPTVALRALSFDRGASIPRDVRRLISEKGWEVATARAYPAIVVIDPEGEQHLPTSRDHLILSVAAQAVAAAAGEQREALVEGAELTMTLVVDAGAGPLEVTLRSGHWGELDEGEPLEYDPATGPSDRDRWLELDEHDRLDAIRVAHEGLAPSSGTPAAAAGADAANPHAHAAFHMIVENQLALDDPRQTRKALARLMGEGLDRHEAVHAIGAVVAEHLYTASRSGRAFSSQSYAKQLARIDAEWWRAQASAPAPERTRTKKKPPGGTSKAKSPRRARGKSR